MTLILIAIILGIIGLDQLTKWLTVIYLDLHESVPVWEDVFHFTYAQNDGAAWGILDDHRWVFMVFSTIAIIALSVYLFRFRPKSRYVQIVIAMIIGGGTGNMIDRTILGYVIDFFDFTLIDFPVFNVADCFITVGAFMLVGYMTWDLIREMREERAKKKAESETSHGTKQ